MTFDDLKYLRLANQHLLAPADAHTVVRDLCGVQAQFLSNAFHALTIRSDDFSADKTDGLMKAGRCAGRCIFLTNATCR